MDQKPPSLPLPISRLRYGTNSGTSVAASRLRDPKSTACK